MFNILILLALQFFILPKDKCKMLTKMLTLSKVHQIETSSMTGTRVQVMSNRKQEYNWLVIDNLNIDNPSSLLLLKKISANRSKYKCICVAIIDIALLETENCR